MIACVPDPVAKSAGKAGDRRQRRRIPTPCASCMTRSIATWLSRGGGRCVGSLQTRLLGQPLPPLEEAALETQLLVALLLLLLLGALRLRVLRRLRRALISMG